MVSRRAVARFALPIALMCVGGAADAPIVIRAQSWTLADETLASALTQAPAECLGVRTPSVEIGRALFRSPALLGGPAARAGLSCNACHSNGRTNAYFFLPELTDRAGASDVTSEWASRVRGDGVLNPIDIPDLVDVGSRTAHGRNRDPSLEHFVRSVIVEEFQGQAPPPQAFDGLLAYLRALHASSCPSADAVETLTLAGAADDVRRALAAAQSADTPTKRLLLLAAQDGLGRIVERLPRAGFARERSAFEGLARELGAVRNHNAINTALDLAAPGWLARFDASIARVARRQRRTSFDERTLARALKR